MDSITRIKEFIKNGFPSWEKIDFSKFKEKIDFRTDWSELYKIDHEEIILISYTNISITGTDRSKPQLRVFLDEYKKPFYFAKRHQIRYYLFSIFTKDDEMAKGLNNFDPKKYIISIETNLDNETSRRDLRSIYDYANDNLGGRKYLKCSRSNYKADINQASFIYIGSSEAPEIEIFNNFITYFDSRPYLNSINEENPKEVNHASSPLQQIFYGAPGTGKSHKVKNITETAYPNEEERDEFVSRTTFHPDYDYASFVGCYKPKKEDDKITYSFVPQVFTNAYIKAWKEMKNEEPKPVYLVIEEINRGNCAQIFGDLFQLLDRGDDGYSEYPIDIDDDLKNYLIEKLGPDSEGVKDGKMCLPPNLNIWATMNTSDQSLFPMDSAFKRRWEWEYVKIADAGKKWKIKLDDGFGLIDWWTFLKRINRVVAELTTSEDKQLGYFFCKPDVKLNDADEEPTIISAKRFVNKVIFYLWNDVFKGYAYDADCCKDVNQKEVLYEKFYSEDGISPEIEVLKVFFDKLKNEGEASLVVDGTTDGDTPQPEESTNETAAEGNETEA